MNNLTNSINWLFHFAASRGFNSELSSNTFTERASASLEIQFTARPTAEGGQLVCISLGCTAYARLGLSTTNCWSIGSVKPRALSNGMKSVIKKW